MTTTRLMKKTETAVPQRAALEIANWLYRANTNDFNARLGDAPRETAAANLELAGAIVAWVTLNEAQRDAAIYAATRKQRGHHAQAFSDLPRRERQVLVREWLGGLSAWVRTLCYGAPDDLRDLAARDTAAALENLASVGAGTVLAHAK